MIAKPRIICADGTSLSVQASGFHYCKPRVDDPVDGFTHKEVGFPRDKDGNSLTEKMPARWEEYAEKFDENDYSGVFAYVPVELIEDFIKAHGGERKGE